MGATAWMRGWARRGWRTTRGRPVANRDLWQELQARVDDLRAQGAEVSFWLAEPCTVVRQSALYREAKDAAGLAALQDPVYSASEFTKVCGIRV